MGAPHHGKEAEGFSLMWLVVSRAARTFQA